MGLEATYAKAAKYVIPMGHLSGLMSTAMILEAPAALAPMMTASPTHPHPNTATLDPACSGVEQ